jgi:regulator of cell morphogenesis and NO signaling
MALLTEGGTQKYYPAMTYVTASSRVLTYTPDRKIIKKVYVGRIGMQFSSEKTVRELAVEVPGATRLFEKMGIDYCCGGAKPITEACQSAGVSLEQIAASFEQLRANHVPTGSKDWQAEGLAALITHIYEKHHVFTREELSRIGMLLAKVCSVYGDKRPELLEIQTLFARLKDELIPHMMKEENVLFPYITQMESAISSGLSAPVPMFGTVRNPVRMMMFEHDLAGEVLRRIRQLSDDFYAPAEACMSYRTLYSALEGLEQDLHQHIHLENNILFPRAIEMES